MDARKLDIKLDTQLTPALRFIQDCSSPLFLDGELAGSGTFIAWDDEFGILTAHHVPNNPQDGARRFNFSADSAQKLGLSLVNFPHRFELEMRNLSIANVAGPIDANDLGRGPDLAVIRLGTKATVTDITARKTFYKTSHRSEERLRESARDDGVFVVCGAAKEAERLTGSELGFEEVATESLDTYYGGLVPPYGRRFERDGYDYLELGAEYKGVDDPPSSFRGVSGGGLWRIPVDAVVHDERQYDISEPILVGVAFYQTEVIGNLRYLRCHAGDAVCTRVLNHLRDNR